MELGRQTLSYWFNDLRQGDFQFDVILGQIPARNKRAVNYTKKIGMVELGTVPMIKYKPDDDETGAYFCYITREGF